MEREQELSPEELFLMPRGFDASKEIDKISAAMAKAQQQFASVKKNENADTGTYNYSYASLADSLSAVVPALNDNGISLLQPVTLTHWPPSHL